jgi:cytochrome c-type biogenesis protein CcmH/NrfG
MQVGKAYFELVDYLEADWAFSLARQASPYSLEGMDMYSTVLYVSSHNIVLEKIVHFSPGCNLKINSLRWVT